VAATEPGAIAAAIEELASEDLRAMGEAGRRWMKREFSWGERARRMLEVYEAAIEEARRLA
jgi:glycosyltransferase involved in cell wall biosynthesis